MGAWGTAVLSDDLAGDISFRYKDLLGEEYSGEEASRLVINEFLGEVDSEEVTVFWLSFALIQWKAGRLQEQVKNKAIEIIDSGADLERWEEEPKLLKKRTTVLQKLKEQLSSPQPQAKKVPKRFVADTHLKAGDAVSYELLSGNFIILKVVKIIEEWTGDRYPLFEICDWIGKEIPSKTQIDDLKMKNWTWDNGVQEVKRVAVVPAGKRDNPKKRIKVEEEGVELSEVQQKSYTLCTWKDLDENLKEFYHFE
ncbi:hypothetical protein NCCP2716_26370 [Sporosarcina sp. NCCP-2716]|uniref:hypothetical protein n=1 Tax=Sporosarcina sp. NCCP-2716 TaxID=2943679 RepID=UPI00203E813C|nr:hypothetical protein [Sporosarcina sp. NCCP-2716]GKV70139.1 hypothetical protein NCCP2716_26370 [Sporosarcina sp. NCCP-2716]